VPIAVLQDENRHRSSSARRIHAALPEGHELCRWGGGRRLRAVEILAERVEGKAAATAELDLLEAGLVEVVDDSPPASGG
jgi:hypothetical protein